MRLPPTMKHSLPLTMSVPHGEVELVIDGQHFHRIVREALMSAKISLDIATADFKAMLVPDGSRNAHSIVQILANMARKGVEIRLLHAGTPSSSALRELKRGLPEGLIIRRCPRLHAKTVIVDCAAMYLGSANLTGAGLGAKSDGRRNFEWGVWSRSAAMIDAIQEQFNAIWEGHRCKNCQRKDVCPVPLEEPSL